MTTATRTSKGQITIPIDARNDLKVDAGDSVEFVHIGPGRYEFVAATRANKAHPFGINLVDQQQVAAKVALTALCRSFTRLLGRIRTHESICRRTRTSGPSSPSPRRACL